MTISPISAAVKDFFSRRDFTIDKQVLVRYDNRKCGMQNHIIRSIL